MGLVAGLFIWLYLSERKRASADADKADEENRAQRERHFQQLDDIRKSQIAREQEISATLEQYGRSCVAAVEQTMFLAKELRRIHDRERQG
jgi:uncharacterized membrane protein